ncbi:MAG: NAD(P)H-dependent oxidoreductase [Dehalococcoidia bacterium]|nr:NAD(P)H-dependent oxidoreductase [Dehalococcoidia bacterium]
MPKTRTVAVLAGSLRRESYSRKLARALEKLAPESLEFEHISIGKLPHYNEDMEASGELPEQWVKFRNKVKEADAVLFVTPEYNRSIPGVLKNALDVGSRPYGQSAWQGKPGAVVSVSPGAIGAFGANHHLRQALTFLDVPTMQQPEAYIGGAAELFDEEGNLGNESTAAFLSEFMKSFEGWIEANEG